MESFCTQGQVSWLERRECSGWREFMLSHLQQRHGQLSVDSRAGWTTAETNAEVLVEEEKNCDVQIAGEWVSHSSYCWNKAQRKQLWEERVCSGFTVWGCSPLCGIANIFTLPASSLAPSGRVYWTKLFSVVSTVNAWLFCVLLALKGGSWIFFLSRMMSNVLGNGLVFFGIDHSTSY